MGNDSVGLVDLRRNLSALLETTQRQPLLVHRYGTPWACVVSDAQWDALRGVIAFDPEEHPLSALLALQRHHLPLSERGSPSPAACARLLLLQSMHGFQDVETLSEQVRYDRLHHWFVAGASAGSVDWPAEVIEAALAHLLDDAEAHARLHAFISRAEVREVMLTSRGRSEHCNSATAI